MVKKITGAAKDKENGLDTSNVIEHDAKRQRK